MIGRAYNDLLEYARAETHLRAALEGFESQPPPPDLKRGLAGPLPDKASAAYDQAALQNSLAYTLLEQR